MPRQRGPIANVPLGCYRHTFIYLVALVDGLAHHLPIVTVSSLVAVPFVLAQLAIELIVEAPCEI